MSPALQLALTGLLVLLNGFFVAAEFALVKVRATRIEELAKEGKTGARMVQHALRHLDVYLSASQVGISLASIALGWVGEPAVSHLLAPLLAPLQLSEAWLHRIATGVSLGIVTGLHIVVGEQAPKYWAIQRAEAVSLGSVYPLHIFYWICRPAISGLNTASNLLLRLLKLETATEHALDHTEEELRMILTASGRSGVLKDNELDLVQHVFEFADKVASDIMVPRVDMVYLDASAPLEQNLAVARSHTYTRYPLCDGNPDRVLGMIHVRDLMVLGARGGDIRSIRREMPFVAETKSIGQLLREFQRGKRHMATVVDEYGGTAGIVTLEDILEEIVGEIHDEFEVARSEVQRVSEGVWVVDGRAALADLRVSYGVDLPDGEADTLGGWILEQLGAIPERGSTVEAGGYRILVETMEGQRVRTLRVSAVQPADTETPETSGALLLGA
ncbi:MAG: HlyC/CorC family transporter [Armatimonadetes bacterium]|nr:HlyC/CorC family transporter [Armatimonadota bacterium]